MNTILKDKLTENKANFSDLLINGVSFNEMLVTRYKVSTECKIFDFSNVKEDIFFKIIYPLYPKEFMFGEDFNRYSMIIAANVGICVVAFCALVRVLASHYANTLLNAVVSLCVL